MEAAGVPTVLCCTDRFTGLAQAVARTAGRPDLMTVSVPHPVAGLEADAVEALADQVCDRIVSVLTGRSEG